MHTFVGVSECFIARTTLAMVPGEKVVYKSVTSSSSCLSAVFLTFLFLVGWSRQWGAVRVGEEHDVLYEEVPEKVVPIAFKKSVEMLHCQLVGSRCLALRSIVVRMEAYTTDGKQNSIGHGLAGEDRLSST